MRIELPDPADPSNVISIEEVRHEYERRKTGRECMHNRVTVSAEEIVVKCRDCGERVATNAWLLDHRVEVWSRVKNLYAMHEQTLKKIEAKQRVRCQHCNRITGTTRDMRLKIVREVEGRSAAPGETTPGGER